MISDERLREAARKVEESFLASLPEPEECEATFSPEFERKMKKLIRRTDHPIKHRIMKAVACCLLVVLVGGGSVLTLSAEARAAFVGWVQEIYESLVLYHFEGTRDTLTKDVVYCPSWIPEGYQESTPLDLYGQTNVIYENDSSSIIIFSYSNDSKNFYVSLDDAVVVETRVNDFPAELYLYDVADSLNTLVWTDSTTGAILWISADLDNESLIKFAEGVEKVEE